MTSKRSATVGDATARRLARECLAVRVRTLARTVTRIYDDALRPLGLTVGQLNLLAAVANLQPDGATVEEIGEALDMEASTLSRNLALLERKGWMQARPRAHGRGRCWHLTSAGRDLLARARHPWSRAQRRAREVLASYGVERLRHPVLDASAGGRTEDVPESHGGT